MTVDPDFRAPEDRPDDERPVQDLLYTLADGAENQAQSLQPLSVAMEELLEGEPSVDLSAFPPDMKIALGDGLPIIAIPPQADLVERAEKLNLYDARFEVAPNHDQAGQATDYALRCVEVYANPATAELAGQALSIGTYASQEEAAQQYGRLQQAIGGAIPPYAVAAVGEQIAIENGLWPQWQPITASDLEPYRPQVDLNKVTDLPPDDMAVKAPVFAPHTAFSVEQQQAMEALRTIGLEPPADFNLFRDTYLDSQTGIRCMAGIFQQDLGNPSANCQATFVALEPAPEGGLQADAVAVGVNGSFEQAFATWSTLAEALEQDGPEGAIRAMEGIERDLNREGVEPDGSTPAIDEGRDQEAVAEPGGSWLDIN
jgi:hypothetical protein